MMWKFLFFGGFFAAVTHLNRCFGQCSTNPTLRSPRANLTIGGMFPVFVQRSKEGRLESVLNYYSLSWIEAMLFSIDEINNSPQLLSNYSLGFDIRNSCNDVNIALKIALDFILEDSTSRNESKSCGCERDMSRVSAIVGGAASPISTKVGHVFSVSDVPQISYSSTSVLLSNKETYRSFLRTIPSDTYQAKSIADLLAKFNWTYVSVVASDSEYGRAGMDALKTELKKRNICLALDLIFHPNMYTHELTEIISMLKNQVRAKVVVLWCQRPSAIGFLQHATELGLTGKTWIGTETWGDSYLLYDLSPDIIGGMLGVVPQLQTYEPFEAHLSSINPSNPGPNPWLGEYWKQEYHCQIFNVSVLSDVNMTSGLYTANKYFFYQSNTDANVIIVCPKHKGRPSASRLPRNKCTNVMDAVFAIAHSVNAILDCKEGHGLLALGKCPEVKPIIQHKDILTYVRNVSFVSRSGTIISFDKNGDLMHGAYSIKILQQERKNSSKMEFIEFGSWEGNKGKWDFINETKFKWNGWTDEIPSSRCNELCQPGEYAVNGSVKCCWTCVICPRNHVKKSRGLQPCVRCPAGYESNANRSVCIRRKDYYLSWSSDEALSVIVVSVIGIVHGACIIIVFIRHRSTAVVKASNRELSILHLTFLIASFSFSFVLIGEPTPVRCGARPFLFALIFTISTSITLLKTDRLLRIFRSRSRHSSQSRLMTNKMQIMTAGVLTSLPLLVASMWVVIRPPAITISDSGLYSRVVRCNDDVDTLQMIILCYVLLLALVSTYFAYRARRLPENFNEAKFIGFAMFSFCVFWLSFVPAFYSSTGTDRAFVHCLAVIFSTISITCIMYYPKLRIILFFPDKNTAELYRINVSTANIRLGSQRSRSFSMPSRLIDQQLSQQAKSSRMSALAVGGDIVFS